MSDSVWPLAVSGEELFWVGSGLSPPAAAEPKQSAILEARQSVSRFQPMLKMLASPVCMSYATNASLTASALQTISP